MASTVVPELILRFPAAPSPQPRRRSENINVETGTPTVVGPMIGVYQRTLSFGGDPAISSESDIGDNCDEDMNADGAANSPVAGGHALDMNDDEDGDDDVFDTSPPATTDTKSPSAVISDGQYDDLSFSSALVQRQDEPQRQQPSSVSNLNDVASKKLPMQVIVSRKNVSVPDSSHNSVETMTSTIVAATNNSHCHHQQPILGATGSAIPESPAGTPTGISLFEKLVRTHPIWYLPHIGRVAAVHLLRGKSPGVFIVRRSSQPNSMAISIKLPPGGSQDIEHYLLETTIAGVHLEGSPNYFRELPFLLAYYCENGDELHTTLTLPRAILECETLRDLCSLALLGPEFWTSKHCAIDSSAVGDNNTAVAADTGPKQRPPSPPTRLKDEMGSKPTEKMTKEKLVQSESNPENITRSNITAEVQMQQLQSALYRRSLSISGYPGATANNGSAANRVLPTTAVERVGGVFRKPAPFPNPVKDIDVEHSPASVANPKKHGQKERSVLSKFRSESVSSRVTDGQQLVKEQPEQSPQQERRSFRLRNLFDVARRPSVGSLPSPSSSVPQQQSKFGLAVAKCKKAKGPFDLAKKDGPDPVSDPRSENDHSTKEAGRQQQSVFYVHRRPAPAPPMAPPSVPERSSRKISPASPQIPHPDKSKEDHEYYYFSPMSLPSPSFAGVLNESKSISSLLQEAAAAEERQQATETPTMARRRLLTFKPGSPGNDGDVTPTTSSADTTLERGVKKTTTSLQTLPAESKQRVTPPAVECRQQSAPPPENPPPSVSSPGPTASFIRPPVLRREKSDLGWLPSSINRIGGVYATESSKLLQQQRHAILPPENKDDTFKTCVEELRRRRLESLRQQMVSNTNILHSRRDGSPHVLSPGSTKTPMVVANAVVARSPRASPTMNATSSGNFGFSPSSSSAPTSATNSVLRTKSTRQHGMGSSGGPSHRLSAPNLAELSATSVTASGATERRPVAELLREIRSRQQQKPVPANAGGLHTINEGLVTPMARRRHGAAKRSVDGSTERRLSQSLEDLPTITTISEDFPKQVIPAPTPTRKSAPEKSSKSTSCHLPVRRHESNSSALSSAGVNRRNEKAFHDETNFQWVAVTNEMRNRQKVAKVAPTRSPYASQTNSGSATLGNKFSDYVMLNECAEIISDFGSNGEGVHNEDAEYGNGRYGSIVAGDSRRQDSQVFNVATAGFLSSGNCQQQFQDVDIDDTRSVVSAAGTVFNEPWDSSVWENLLTLASSMDKNTNRTTTDSRTSFSTSSAASSNRPSRIESTSAIEARVSTASKEDGEKARKHHQQKSTHTRQTSAWAERLRKLKENNIPPPLAPNWEEFSSCVPMSSDSSLPTSTPTNSLESRRKSLMAAAETLWSHSEDGNATKGSIGDDASPLNEDRFHLAPVASPLRFRYGNAASNRRGAADRSKKRPVNDPGFRIQECVERLSTDISTFFGAQVQYFIKCTTEGHETDPLIVLGNVRQFMNGLKNYLVKHGECDLHPLIEQERSKLRPTEFLNIDAILEGVLQKIILAPLKPHLYHLLVKEGSSNGSLEVLSENLAMIRNRPPVELGITADSCDSSIMEQVRNNLRKMQYHYSPLKKLEYLLHAVSVAYEHRQGTPVVGNGRSVSSSNQLPCADELLRWFVYLVSRCSMVGCEIESVYIWNLLHPALLAGEASYYLTAFSSAVHVLKHMDLLPKLNDTCSLSSQMSEGGEGFIKVAVPDEVNGAIKYHSFPIMPQLTVARLCRMIARKCGITNPEDYGLYLLVDGYETCLIPSECPELVKEHLRTSNKAHLFAYKRHEAKIAWPKVAVSPRL